jgi:hypothetical protein
VLHIHLRDTFHTVKGTEKVLTNFDLNNITKLVAVSSLDTTTSIMHAIKNVKLRFQEAVAVFHKLHGEVRDKSRVLELLLPLMLDCSQSRALIKASARLFFFFHFPPLFYYDLTRSVLWHCAW